MPTPTIPKGRSLVCLHCFKLSAYQAHWAYTPSRVIKLPPFGRVGVGL